MLELRDHTLAYMFALLITLRIIAGQCIQDCYAPPLGALVESDEKLAENIAGNDEDLLRGSRGNSRIVDVRQCCNSIRDDLNSYQ